MGIKPQQLTRAAQPFGNGGRRGAAARQSAGVGGNNGDHTMRTQTILGASTLLAAGALLGWLSSAAGQEKKPEQRLTPAQIAERKLHRRAVEAVIWGMSAVNYERMLQRDPDADRRAEGTLLDDPDHRRLHHRHPPAWLRVRDARRQVPPGAPGLEG